MSDSEQENASTQHVMEALAHLKDFGELSEEEQRGAIKHAIAALENARREL